MQIVYLRIKINFFEEMQLYFETNVIFAMYY